MQNIVVANELCHPNNRIRLENIVADLFPNMEVEWVDDIGTYLLENEGEVLVVMEKGLTADVFWRLLSFLGKVKENKFYFYVDRISLLAGVGNELIQYHIEREEGWKIEKVFVRDI